MGQLPQALFTRLTALLGRGCASARPVSGRPSVGGPTRRDHRVRRAPPVAATLTPWLLALALILAPLGLALHEAKHDLAGGEPPCDLCLIASHAEQGAVSSHTPSAPSAAAPAPADAVPPPDAPIRPGRPVARGPPVSLA